MNMLPPANVAAALLLALVSASAAATEVEVSGQEREAEPDATRVEREAEGNLEAPEEEAAKSSGLGRERSVLGYAVECRQPEEGICSLIRVSSPAGKPLYPPELLTRGTLEETERALVEVLLEEHGDGHPNLRLWSAGGWQLWGDVFLHSGWRIQQHALTGHHRLLDPASRRVAWGDYGACRAAFEAERLERDIPDPPSNWVVLVHGIFASRKLLEPMEESLREAGFAAVGVNYPSILGDIEEHAEQLELLLHRAEGVERVSFVAHSMGGIVTQRLLARRGRWRSRIEVDRVVLLGTPNQGSVIAEVASDMLPLALLEDSPGPDLTAERLADLPAPDVPFLIIAGGRGDDRGYNPAIPGDDDGIVSVQSTKLAGAEDHLLVRTYHRGLITHPESVAAVLRFLRGEPLEAATE